MSAVLLRIRQVRKNLRFNLRAPDLSMGCPMWYGKEPGKWLRLRPPSWWRHQIETFSALLALLRGIHRSPVNSAHKGHWCGALRLSFICAWINGWVNNRKAGALRLHRTHYDVTVMRFQFFELTCYDTFCVCLWKYVQSSFSFILRYNLY